MKRIFFTASVFSLVGMTASAQYASDWNPDADGDNTIGVNDLLALLSVFEETDSDNDGIFDSQDDCVGVYDACGVCNGSGPTVVVGDSLVCPVYGCTDNLASNFSASANTDDGTCTYGPAQCGGASTVTFDGYVYNLVGIGNQCWFKENLRSDNYRNGDAIPGNLSGGQWSSTELGAQAVYNNSDVNLAAHGRLYNWYAVNDARGLCPTGFRVPTDGEWMVLENFLGGSSVAGGKIKSSSLDTPPWDGTNSSGFSALPGRYRSSTGSFYSEGLSGYWWSASVYSVFVADYAWSRLLFPGNGSVLRNNFNIRSGFSVRCIKD